MLVLACPGIVLRGVAGLGLRCSTPARVGYSGSCRIRPHEPATPAAAGYAGTGFVAATSCRRKCSGLSCAGLPGRSSTGRRGVWGYVALRPHEWATPAAAGYARTSRLRSDRSDRSDRSVSLRPHEPATPAAAGYVGTGFVAATSCRRKCSGLSCAGLPGRSSTGRRGVRLRCSTPGQAS